MITLKTFLIFAGVSGVINFAVGCFVGYINGKHSGYMTRRYEEQREKNLSWGEKEKV